MTLHQAGHDRDLATCGSPLASSVSRRAGVRQRPCRIVGCMNERAPVVAIVYNPTKFNDSTQWKKSAHQICQQEGWADPLLLATTRDDPGQGMTREAVRQDVDLVCAAGGDGTVRQVATVLAGTRTPMGIIGMGTGNILARNLDLPIDDFDKGLRTALRGRRRTIDLGWVSFDGATEQCFTAIIGMGFDADTMANTSEAGKAEYGWIAYIVAALRYLVQPGFRATVTIDGEVCEAQRARSILLCNCGLLPAGIRLVPSARIDDARLDSLALAPHGVVGWLAVAAKVITRSRLGGRLVRHHPCRTAEVRTSSPVLAEVDGDTYGKVRRMSVRVQPMALQVRAAV